MSKRSDWVKFLAGDGSPLLVRRQSVEAIYAIDDGGSILHCKSERYAVQESPSVCAEKLDTWGE